MRSMKMVSPSDGESSHDGDAGQLVIHIDVGPRRPSDGGAGDRRAAHRLRGRLSRWVRTLLGREFRSRAAASVALWYRNRGVASLAVDLSQPRPHVVALPYFGESFEPEAFELRVDPKGVHDDVSVSAVMQLRPPRFSALERSIQAQLPDADIGARVMPSARSSRRLIARDGCAVAEWLIRGGAPARRLRS
jgi:hypothetical protein